MPATIDSTPRADGFRMPAEFEPHAGTWLIWPQRPDIYHHGAKHAQHAWVEFASAVAEFEPVTVGVNADQFLNARALLPACVRVVEVSNDDAWVRDTGPTFVINADGKMRAVDWEFNNWGGQAGSQWYMDNLLARKIAEIEAADRYPAPLVMEGGSFHVDGEGTVLTTESCLLNPNRNPGLSKEQIAEALCNYLGADKVIWLKDGLDPEFTSGHVDDVAFFVRPGVVALAWTDDEDDSRFEALRAAREVLETATDARGRRLEIHTLPLPAEIKFTEEEARFIDRIDTTQDLAVLPMPATYANCYICNGGVILPVFDDPLDDAAFQAMQAIFPDRVVRRVPARELILAAGAVHCASQQVPRHSA